ncbi:transketolase [Petroclostridium sp. X23]|uniref:transketolase n=1 Tax=Petroclostridium sp. X23 TaxID=3045146 RepID=UPI0024ADC66A|nr:transketolase [Petroclostridium sp. X23]WHH56840.1 transketolase [Petroclostridium sp. X23]
MEFSLINELQRKAAKIRMHIVDSVYCAGSGHPGGSLSIAEILSVLYFHEMKLEPNNPMWADRDRFVLSKGHAAPAYYAAIAEKGYIPVEELKNLRKIDSILQGHPDMKKIPGIDMSTGSLGQGLSAANGMALVGKADQKDYRVYAIVGDGEIQEGQIWEAVMTAAHYKLDNLTVFLDHNGLQIDGNVTQVMSPYPLKEKFSAFGWNVIEIDGNDIAQIMNAIQEAKQVKDMPTVIICNTVKGKGVSFMENQVGWHGAAPSKEQYDMAIGELQETLKKLEGE